MGKIKSKKVECDGHLFDSLTEMEYYLHLKKQTNIESIELQPKFILMDKYTVLCHTCNGEGKIPSPKTGNPVKCKRCNGTGRRDKQPWTYKADFRVTYKDGTEDIIDVKGFVPSDFRLIRKMFEYKTGRELVIVKKVKGEWVRS